MRRLLVPSLLLLVLGVAAPASARVHARYGMRLARCHHAVAPADRSFHLVGGMRRLRGTDHMAIRVSLQVRLGGQRRWHRYTRYFAAEPLYGEWIPSARGSDRYRFARTVNQLEGPVSATGRHRSIAFRVRAAFRWYASDHRVQLTRHDVTAACFQPELRPNLLVRSIVPVTSPAGTPGFVVTVHNAGRTDAGPFALALGTRSVTVPGLAAHRNAHRFFRVTEPCAEPLLTATADPSPSAVDEADESDNSLSIPCS